MSKYILKKDLPFAKAGDEINLTNEMLDHNCVSVKGNDGMMWEIGFYEDVNQLISDGWIEEVKEDKRKWWEKLDTEIPKMRIRELVEKYPREVQKEVMKHASRQMKEWYDLKKNEYTSEKILREFIKSIHDDLHQEPIKFEPKKEPNSLGKK